MKCFYHQDRDAVGSCKSCGKGLCPECAVDLGKGLACRNRCEDDAKAVIALIEQNIKITARTAGLVDFNKRARAAAYSFYFIMGSIFAGWGLTDPGRLVFLIILGACFNAYGVFLFVQSKGVERQRKEMENNKT
jgi:hypothetical protein